MIDFVELSRDYNIDRIIFNRIENWNTDPDFVRNNIFAEDHPLHNDVKKILDKIMLIRKNYPEKFIEGTAIPY